MTFCGLLQPNYPTYPNPLSASQSSSGLAAPAAAAVLMGKGGAVAVLLVVLYVVFCLLMLVVNNNMLIFSLSMAVTSAASSELIAVSSIVYVSLEPSVTLCLHTDSPLWCLGPTSNIRLLIHIHQHAEMGTKNAVSL